MNLILLGPPGAGKGTQAAALSKAYSLEMISTGEILRQEIRAETSLGLQVKEIVESGGFPSDDLILEILYKRMNTPESHSGVILDGVPRTINQAEKVDLLFEKLGRTLDHVIELRVNDEKLIKRLSSRYTCKNCGAIYSDLIVPQKEGQCNCGGEDFIRRSDDKPESVKKRLEVYYNQTKPLIDFYKRTKRLKSVDGMQGVDEVFNQIESILS